MTEQNRQNRKSYLPKSYGMGRDGAEQPRDKTAPAPGNQAPPLEPEEEFPVATIVETAAGVSEESTVAARQEHDLDSQDECCVIYGEPSMETDDFRQATDDIPSNQIPHSEGAAAADDGRAKFAVTLVGVRFSPAGKIYSFDADNLKLDMGDWVVTKTEKGVGLGQVAVGPYEKEVTAQEMEALRKVARKAGKVDMEQRARCEKRETQARKYCLERVEALDLPMKLVAVECFFDGSKYVFYFTSEGRVDFRELVKQLVARFPVRIEMRQIGVRHEAKMIGGLACCGQELCCARYLTDFKPVSVRMAKAQNLSLNPTKISGVCGRLMCCLSYEHDTYESFKKGLPKVGKCVCTQRGEGVVVKLNPLSETVQIKLDEEHFVEVGKDEIIASPEQPPKKKKSGRKAEKSAEPDVDTEPAAEQAK